MENISGLMIKDFIVQLFENQEQNRAEIEEMGKKIGEMIGRMHDGNVIHGDLTTSNILRQENGELVDILSFFMNFSRCLRFLKVLIDFGLSYTSTLHEDKAVDLYVLERAISSTVPDASIVFDEAVREYTQVNRTSSAVLSRFREGKFIGEIYFAAD
jgi:TP53 regulating kinase-like protein